MVARLRLLVAAVPAVLLGALLVPAPAAAAAPAPVAATAACANVFPAAFRDDLARRFPDQRVTAAVIDTRTGCTYHLHRGMRITTASVIKAGVMGAVILRAQDRGRGLTDWERARISPMIRYSYNNPYVSDLLNRVGGMSGLARYERRMGATATRYVSAYGATVTTAEDRTKVSLRMLHGGGPLRPAARAEAWRYMSRVHPTQQWGITAGVPTGWSVALKNGFYPMRGNGWRIGSTGFVRDGSTGQGYAITVMTDRNRSHVAGMRLAETVSRRVAAVLAGPAGPRLVDRSICVTTRSGESWQGAARRVGQPASSWRAVRRVSGGNSSPLSGQRVCSPYLRPA